MCMAAENCKLQERVEKIDRRVTKLEDRMNDGFTAVTNAVSVTNAAVDKLASEFGTRMNNIDTRLVESKVKWGEWVRASLNSVGRWVGKWGGIIILAALGLSNAKGISEVIGSWFRSSVR